MPWSQSRAVAAALIAVVTAVAFTVAPVAAVDGADTTQAEESDDEFPEEFCTDITGAVGDEVPYDQVIWVDDLPEEAQPPGVPWNIITPRAVGAIVVGAAPNQCDVFDPNDPPYDPREDEVDPDGGGDVVEETDDGTTLIIVNGTLDSTSEGPGGEAIVEFDPSENGELDPEVRINDGEKDYTLDPGVQYWDDGTVYVENDVVVIGKRAGVEFDCVGEECEIDIRGAPGLVDYPSIPSHSEDDPREDTDDGDGDDGEDDDVDAPGDGEGTQDTSSDDGVDDSIDTDGDTDDGDGDDAGDGSDDGSDSSGDGSDGDDGSDDADGEDDDQSDDGDGDDADEPAEVEDDDGDHETAQAQVDGPGFGAAAALLSVLAATMIARRRLS